MEYDQDQVDEMVLALLYLTSSRDQYATRAWKGLSLDVLNRLHAKGYIGDPMGKSATLTLSQAGARLSQELFFKHFGVKEPAAPEADASKEAPREYSREEIDRFAAEDKLDPRTAARARKPRR